MDKEEIILGIDPGTTVMGYGLISRKGQQMTLLSLGVVQLKAYASHPLKLKNIFERTLSLISQYHPDCLAIEAPFYGKNVQVMLKLGRAQGVAMARSEEHTSELQSLMRISYAVFCLKKKTKTQIQIILIQYKNTIK